MVAAAGLHNKEIVEARLNAKGADINWLHSEV